MYVHRSQRIYHIVRENFVKKPSDKPDTRGLAAEIPKSKRKLFDDTCSRKKHNAFPLIEDKKYIVVQIWYVLLQTNIYLGIHSLQYIHSYTYPYWIALYILRGKLCIPILCYSPQQYCTFVGESLHVFSSSKRGIQNFQKYLQTDILNSIHPVTDYQCRVFR